MSANDVIDIIDIANEMIAFDEMVDEEELLVAQIAAYARVA